MSDEENLMIQRLEKRIIENGVSNEFLVQNIILSGSYLNLKTIQKYAKDNKMTYRGVKNHRKIVNLFGINFVIDND